MKINQFDLFNFLGAISFVGLIFVVINFFTFNSFWPYGINNPYLAFIRDYFFLNSLHVPIIFVLLATESRFSAWAHQTPSIFFKFKYEVLAAVCFFALVSFYGGAIGRPIMRYKYIDNVEAYLIFNVLFFFLSTFHAIGQQYGILCIMNESFVDKLKFQKHLHFESLLYKFLPGLYFLIQFRFFLVSVEHPWSHFESLLNFFHITFVICISLVLCNCLFFDKDVRYKKLFFLSRLLIYPFVGFVPFANLMTSICHGTEYIIPVRNVIRNSEKPQRLSFYLAVTVLVWGIIAIPRYQSSYIFLGIIESRYLFTLFSVVDLLHYWLDRMAFRMRNPLNRALIAPMLKS